MKKKSTKLLTALLVSSMLCATPSVAFAQDTASTPTDKTTTEGTLPADVETPDTLTPEIPAEPEAPVVEPEVPAEPQVPLAAYSADDDYSYGHWEYTNGKYWFQFDDGSYAYDTIWVIDGTPYAFDSSGWMVTGWYYFEEDYYYFDASGAMHFGWLELAGNKYYLDPDAGFMYSGCLVMIDEWYYFFMDDGSLASGWEQLTTTDPDTGETSTNWYYFNADSSIYKGWLYLNGSWYYLDPNDGYMYSDGFYWIDGAEYAFHADGRMVDGWYSRTYEYDDGSVETVWYYIKNGTDMYTGWNKIGGSWYYFGEWGGMYSDGVYIINELVYGFDASGRMSTGWHAETYLDEHGETITDWFYFDSNGQGHNGWLYNGGAWYYCYDGYMDYDNFVWDEATGALYCLDANGKMVTNGWYYSYYEEWYYFDANGQGHNGWLYSGGTWYYFNNGWMLYDIIYPIGDSLYLFAENGAMASQPGWYSSYTYVDGEEYYDWYYVKDSSGKLKTGWLFNNGNWYYLDEEFGFMYYDTIIKIDGEYNEFDENGVWLGITDVPT